MRRRHPEQSAEVNKYLDEIDAQKESMTGKAISGEISVTDFTKWLESMKIKKETNI